MPHPMPTDPEVVEFIERTNAFYPADAYRLTIEENRDLYDRYSSAFRAPRPEGVEVGDFAIPGRDDQPSVPARRYRATAASVTRPALLYLHGGGFVLGGLDSHDDVCAELAGRTGLEVVAIAYRLAPEHLHPAQGDDAETAFLHLARDGRPVIVAGDSAGGNLAAALCLRRRDKGAPRPLAQVLIYPGLGGDSSRGSYVENARAPLLTREESFGYFGIRTGGGDRHRASDPDLMPLCGGDFSGLPPAFLVSADIDPLRDDARDYARKLQAAGVPAVCRNEPQLVHGYLRARRMSRRAAESFTAICEAVSRFADAEPAAGPAAGQGAC